LSFKTSEREAAKRRTLLIQNVMGERVWERATRRKKDAFWLSSSPVLGEPILRPLTDLY